MHDTRNVCVLMLMLIACVCVDVVVYLCSIRIAATFLFKPDVCPVAVLKLRLREIHLSLCLTTTAPHRGFPPRSRARGTHSGPNASPNGKSLAWRGPTGLPQVFSHFRTHRPRDEIPSLALFPGCGRLLSHPETLITLMHTYIHKRSDLVSPHPIEKDQDRRLFRRDDDICFRFVHLCGSCDPLSVCVRVSGSVSAEC